MEQLLNRTFLKQVKKDLFYSIFSLHSRWNGKEVMTLLEKKVPAFTIVRSPVDVFISHFHFISLVGRLFGRKDVHEMVRIVHEGPHKTVLFDRLRSLFGRNQMADNLGLSPLIYENKESTQREIEWPAANRIPSEISDRRDESLIRLQKLFHWPI